MNYYILIYDFENKSVVKKMGPMDERKADKVDSGVNRNLNHDEYFTLMKFEAELTKEEIEFKESK